MKNRSREVSRFIFLTLGSLSSFVATPSQATANDNRPVALIYKGKGSCDDNECSKAVARIARSMNLTIRYVESSHLQYPETFRNAVLWVQPGGDAIDAANDLQPSGLEILRTKVREGLNYLGICSGAFLADRTVDDAETIGGLGLIPFSTYDYPGGLDQKAKVLPMTWGMATRYIYFQGGPSFRLPTVAPEYLGVQVFSRYYDGEVAGLKTRFGEGNVVLSAVHPEATADWLLEDNLTDPDGLDTEQAQQLFVKALAPTVPRTHRK